MSEELNHMSGEELADALENGTYIPLCIIAWGSESKEALIVMHEEGWDEMEHEDEVKVFRKFADLALEFAPLMHG